MAGDGKVSLSWGSVTGASGYTIYRDTNSGVHPANGTATQIMVSAVWSLKGTNAAIAVLADAGVQVVLK